MRVAAEAEAKQLAEEEKNKLLAAEEAKRAAKETEARQLAEEEEAKRGGLPARLGQNDSCFSVFMLTPIPI